MSSAQQSQQRTEKQPLYDIDPSTGRKVPHKRINNAYLVHQRWVEKQERLKLRQKAKAEGRPLPPGDDFDAEEEPSFVANAIFTTAYAGFVVLVIALLAGQFIHGDFLWGYRGKWTKWQTYFPPKMRVFTPDELLKYNGDSGEGPVYLAIKGDVFDVTPGRCNYGSGGPYHFFAGRDASRAYVTGCFDTHLTHDLRGLTPAEQSMLDGWYSFYAQHPQYFKVGTVQLPYIDPATPIPPSCNQPRDQKP